MAGAAYTPFQPLADAAEAGSVLTPEPGIYTAPVRVDKPSTTDGRDQVTIDGGSKGTVVLLETDGATLRNLHLTNSRSSHNDLDSGVQVRGKFNVISDNRIDNALFGVDLQQSENNIVRRNRMSSKPVDLGVRGDAIRLWYSFNNQVTDTVIRDSRDTVVWYSRDNLIAHNGIGIRFISDWQGNVLTGNRFKGTTTQVVVEGSQTANRNTRDGNYWHDDDGFDRNDDGIGDAPLARAGVRGKPHIKEKPTTQTKTKRKQKRKTKKLRKQGHREFLRSAALLVGMVGASLVGLIPLIGQANARLRPPGALKDRLDEQEFLSACIKCGQCVQVCPVEAITPADINNGVGIGVPHIEARDQACDFSCDGLQCMLACPTGALTHDIDYPAEARMGLARLARPGRCLAVRVQPFNGAARGQDHPDWIGRASRSWPRYGLREPRPVGLVVVLTLLLCACGGDPGQGPVEVKWDRDAWERCRMVLSDRLHSAQVRVPTPDGRSRVDRFDNIGCALIWLDKRAERDDPATEIWLNDWRTGDWIDARTATYLRGQVTPMEYGLGAQPEPAPDGLDFAQAKAHIFDVEDRFNVHGGHIQPPGTVRRTDHRAPAGGSRGTMLR